MDFKEHDFKEVLELILEMQQEEKMKDRIFGSLKLKVSGCDEENRIWADYIYRKQEAHLNPYNGVHGGIACVIADSCMGNTICAATQYLPSTTDMSTSYLRPMGADEYRVHVEIKKIGGQLAAAVCEIFELETNMLCVNAMGKYILIKKDILADEHASKLMKEA